VTALDLDLQNAAGAPDLPKRREFRRWAKEALRGRRKRAGLVIRIVDERESADLNGRYRGKPRATNVLSFPWEPPIGEESDFLGDLVICDSLVGQEASALGKEPPAHWAHLVVHGVLHLLGYDHQTERDAVVMEALEAQVLERLGCPDPYD